MTTRTRTTKILNSVNGQLTRFVTQMWLEEDKLNWLLNFLAPGMVYLVLVFVINRFWVATAVVPELLRTLVFARPCGGDQFAAGTVSPSLDMSR